MDLDLLLAEADPARHADLPGPDSPGAARLYRQITGPAPRPRRMRRAAPVAAGLLATAAAAALVLVNLPGGAQPGSTQPGSVAAILDAAAITAGHGAGASQPRPVPLRRGNSGQGPRHPAVAELRVRPHDGQGLDHG